jgi:nitrogen fixation NifU-like protein
MHNHSVLDHFRHPRNSGELPDATHTVEISNPVCGDILRLAARVEGGRIAEARFQCRGCTAAIAAASVATAQLQGVPAGSASKINAAGISAALGGLPSATFHAAQLAEGAVLALLDAIRHGS